MAEPTPAGFAGDGFDVAEPEAIRGRVRAYLSLHLDSEITDPFGYRWTLSTKVEDLSDEEVQRRAKAAGRAG